VIVTYCINSVWSQNIKAYLLKEIEVFRKNWMSPISGDLKDIEMVEENWLRKTGRCGRDVLLASLRHVEVLHFEPMFKHVLM